MEGNLIVFEGIDGSGKSRQAHRIYNRLKKKKYSVLLFSEPTEGYYGKKIRQIINGKSERPGPKEEVALFIKDREENILRNIKPGLLINDFIILDRYYYSTIAYQGALGLSPAYIRARNEKIAPRPVLVILLEVEVKEGLNRIRDNRNSAYDTYEQKGYLTKVDTIYKSMTDKEIVRIDTNRSIEAIDSDIDEVIDSFLLNNQIDKN